MQAEEDRTARALLVIVPDVQRLKDTLDRVLAQVHALADRYGVRR